MKMKMMTVFSMQLRRLYNYSTVVRWTLFIVPVLLVIWIPGVLSLTMFPRATVSTSSTNFCEVFLLVNHLLDMERKITLLEYLVVRCMGW